MGSQDDPDTWEISPQARPPLRDYAFTPNYYGFDGKLNKVVSEHNTKDMNVFMNFFYVSGNWRRGSDPSAKAFGFVTKKLL